MQVGPPDPDPRVIEDWSIDDCLEFLGIEIDENMSRLIECLSWQTIRAITKDLREVCRGEW